MNKPKCIEIFFTKSIFSVFLLVLEFVSNCVIWNLADRWDGSHDDGTLPVFKTCGVFAGFAFFTGIAQLIMAAMAGQNPNGENVDT